jgi:hypothetical protein
MVRQAHHDVILSHAGLGSMETMALRGPAKLLIDRHRGGDLCRRPS